MIDRVGRRRTILQGAGGKEASGVTKRQKNSKKNEVVKPQKTDKRSRKPNNPEAKKPQNNPVRPKEQKGVTPAVKLQQDANKNLAETSLAPCSLDNPDRVENNFPSILSSVGGGAADVFLKPPISVGRRRETDQKQERRKPVRDDQHAPPVKELKPTALPLAQLPLVAETDG
ncbi:MAG: hypothetical protein V4691_02930, partial [Pseudomonadota bacterium]